MNSQDNNTRFFNLVTKSIGEKTVPSLSLLPDKPNVKYIRMLNNMKAFHSSYQLYFYIIEKYMFRSWEEKGGG